MNYCSKLLGNFAVNQEKNWGFPGGTSGKETTCQSGDARDSGSIPASGRYPGGGNGNPLQYSCLGNPMDRGVWWATVHVLAKQSDMTEHTLLIY